MGRTQGCLQWHTLSDKYLGPLKVFELEVLLTPVCDNDTVYHRRISCSSLLSRRYRAQNRSKSHVEHRKAEEYDGEFIFPW